MGVEPDLETGLFNRQNPRTLSMDISQTHGGAMRVENPREEVRPPRACSPQYQRPESIELPCSRSTSDYPYTAKTNAYGPTRRRHYNSISRSVSRSRSRSPIRRHRQPRLGVRSVPSLSSSSTSQFTSAYSFSLDVPRDDNLFQGRPRLRDSKVFSTSGHRRRATSSSKPSKTELEAANIFDDIFTRKVAHVKKTGPFRVIDGFYNLHISLCRAALITAALSSDSHGEEENLNSAREIGNLLEVRESALKELKHYDDVCKMQRNYHIDPSHGPWMKVDMWVMYGCRNAALVEFARYAKAVHPAKRDDYNAVLIRKLSDCFIMGRKMVANYGEDRSSLPASREVEALLGFWKRLWLALIAGTAVVVPMLIMTLHPSLGSSLGTTSASVFAVAVGLAWIMKSAESKDVIIATAAYAAVLVVFVGAGPSATPNQDPTAGRNTITLSSGGTAAISVGAGIIGSSILIGALVHRQPIKFKRRMASIVLNAPAVITSVPAELGKKWRRRFGAKSNDSSTSVTEKNTSDRTDEAASRDSARSWSSNYSDSSSQSSKQSSRRRRRNARSPRRAFYDDWRSEDWDTTSESGNGGKASLEVLMEATAQATSAPATSKKARGGSKSSLREEPTAPSRQSHITTSASESALDLSPACKHQ
ncbi:uncharacterized protein AB675_7057 [Cyphellophora attinorum]|uniref:DUF6594 domain-containing protein n=1 Tax=Cyphellophora attinorum TaxID=1664694 RepID=A0A0N1H8W0_9EURO|nr:uncharacterized protein AB675_7057 [Phialophora attinorum]KPI43597.1 hypothetical protein AB675_7057 [Phialophora attinorum]